MDFTWENKKRPTRRMLRATAEQKCQNSARSSPRPRSGVAAALLEKLELDDLLNRAFHQLGLTQDHFEEREYDDFRGDGATEEIVALRMRHWEKRRKDLKEELDERYNALVAEQNKPKKTAPGPKDGAPGAASPRNKTDPAISLGKGRAQDGDAGAEAPGGHREGAGIFDEAEGE